MKTWIALFTVSVFAGGASLGVVVDRKTLAPAPASEPARDWGWGGRPQEMSVTRFAEKLGLSEEQNGELDRILAETNRDIEAYRRAQRASTDRARERVTTILTAEQRKQLDELLAGERQKRSEREIEKSLRFYTSVLALTPEQAGPVKEALLEARAKRREHFAQGKHGDWTQMRGFFKTVREEQEKRLSAVLTAEQMKRYREFGDMWDW